MGMGFDPFARETIPRTTTAEKTVEAIRHPARRLYGAHEKVRIVIQRLRGEESIACRAIGAGLGRQRSSRASTCAIG